MKCPFKFCLGIGDVTRINKNKLECETINCRLWDNVEEKCSYATMALSVKLATLELLNVTNAIEALKEIVQQLGKKPKKEKS